MDEPITWPKQSITEQFFTWWRREPVFVTHLAGIGSTLAVLLVSTDTWFPPIRIGLLFGWLAVSWVFQRFANIQRRREIAHLSWVAFDIAIYTLLIYLADSPRGLLLIGYPMMIGASGLFYRVGYVVLATALSIVGFAVLLATVIDPMSSRIDCALIYASGLAVLGFCLVSMIHRVRSLTDYYQS
jgi:serine/threonine-protein kinase